MENGRASQWDRLKQMLTANGEASYIQRCLAQENLIDVTSACKFNIKFSFLKGGLS